MRQVRSPLSAEIFTPELPGLDFGPLVAQGRIVDAVVSHGELHGTPAEIARRLGVGTADLTMAMHELTSVGWLALEDGAGGELTVRWSEEPH